MCDGYIADRVKNGVFQAMMDVELKNDGPVGVEYHSEDAAVYSAFLAYPRRNWNDANVFDLCTGHNRDQHQSS